MRKGETLRRTTSQPLTKPTATASASDIRTTCGNTSFPVVLKDVATTATVAISEATDKPRPRARITKVCPITTMQRGGAWVRMS
nr:hypothetical protein [Paracoccus sp. (in: a-proteobacteria)]